MRKKEVLGCALMMGALVLPMSLEAKVAANSFYDNQTNAQRADITNWVASTPAQISNNMASQKINTNHLDGERYVIQWGDTLWGISQATGISVQKLAYDNHITNVDLIYAGDILILKRDGQVPKDYNYKGSGRNVAQTTININYTYQENNTVVIVNNTSFYEDNHIEHNYPRQDEKAGSSINDSLSVEEDEKDSALTNKDNGSSSPVKEPEEDGGKQETTLSEADYQDAVQDELNKLISEGGDKQVDFLTHATDTGSQVNELTEKELYDSEEKLDVKGMASTKEGAKATAKAIYTQLEADGKLSELTDAVKAQITVTIVDKTEIDFNVTLYNETKESTQDSSSSSTSGRESDDKSSSSSSRDDSYDDSNSDSSQTESSDSVTDYDE
ncbi:MAG: LysM peptidoglycan-binding domain-containing protein [Streptococcus sobrinus]